MFKALGKLLLIIVGLIATKILWDNTRYAGNYYSPELEIVETLASKAWHWGSSPLRRGCTYAVVRFSENTKNRILAGGLEAQTFRPRKRRQRQFGARWPSPENFKKTPVSAVEDDAYNNCRDELNRDLRTTLDLMLYHPGSWAFRAWNRVLIVSPEHQIAAAFRYGD